MELNLQLKETNEWAAKIRSQAEASEIAQAKKEAEAIQAEAKARARVDGEAQVLTTKAMEDATLAVKMAMKSEADIRLQIGESKSKLQLLVGQREGLAAQIAQAELTLKGKIEASAKAQNEWKLLAQTRAGNEAVRIQKEAEARSRARW